MIERIVTRALSAPALVLLLVLGIIAGGIAATRALDIEAYPNPVPPLVEVIAQPSGWSAEEVERYVTVPLEVGLSGMPGLDHVRSQSIFGLSDVKCYFRWGTTYEQARQEVINRLQFVALPQGIQPSISPWNAIGEVFRYRVVGKGYTVAELKTAEDWILERQFKQVPGVVDVVSFGGESKEYHVEVDPYRLAGYGVTISQASQAISNANQNVGGQRLFIGEQSFDVRGLGLLKSPKDIGNVVINAQKGTPVRVKDVATVSIGAAPRLGIVGMNDTPDIVEGIVLMRYGGETAPTLKGIYERLDEIRDYHLLPPGMSIEPYYDRGSLVQITTHTVVHNMLEGMTLVTIILFLFLGSARAALITAINIPIALLIAFGGMVLSGTPANLISLGAVDFGIVVDSTVIMMESIFRHAGPHGRGTMKQRVMAGASEVAGPMTFSTLVIATAFLPLFLLQGVEGVIFAPMARTYALAIGGATILAVSLTPVLAGWFLPSDIDENDNALMRGINRIYKPVVAAITRAPRLATLVALVPIGLGVALFPLLGREFMPTLEEGNFWIRATLPMSISLDQTARYVGTMRRVVMGCPEDPSAPCGEHTQRTHPEVITAVSQLGRPDDGTDVSGFYNVEIFAPLKPFDEWPRGLTKDSLTDELAKELSARFPGVVFNFSQMMSDNVEEALSGIKGENSVKIVGPDIKVNEDRSNQILDIMGNVPGVKDLGSFRSLGQPAIKIAVDREVCARYGLNSGDVDSVIQAAIGGQALTQVFEGERHFDLTVRWAEPYRTSVEAIRHIGVPTTTGAVIPLGQLASITIDDGPAIIYREDGKRYTPVKFSVRGRDLASTVEEAQRKVAAINLPYDTHLEWAGQLNELKEAVGRLAIIVPVTLLLIGLLVYTAVRNWVDTLLVLLAIPVACTGGVLALLITGQHFSVSAAMGFISIFGIAIQDAILVVTYFQRMCEIEGKSIEVAARDAAEKGFRPTLMATLVAMVGLLPAAISNGIGAQTQKPLAIVVIGGALIIAATTRVIRPPLLVVAHRWYDPRAARRAAAESAAA
jgi:cobalt-zinc-cadmium resistance protein CzcA